MSVLANMANFSPNGNGKAVTILPPTTKVLDGRSLAHRHLTKRQRACLAANICDGLTRIVPTQRQVADMCGVSLSYVRLALTLHPDVRVPANVRPRVSTKVVNHAITDSELVTAIRKIGVDRVLSAACMAEAAE
jgi:hypothetical protein